MQESKLALFNFQTYTIDAQKEKMQISGQSHILDAYKAWFITLGCVQQSVTFSAFLIKNQSFIKKFEENEAEIQRIETGTSRGVAQQYLHFCKLLHALVCPTPCHMHMERGHDG